MPRDEYINQANYQASSQLLRRSSFHPNFAGQQAYVRAVINALRYNERTGYVRPA